MKNKRFLILGWLLVVALILGAAIVWRKHNDVYYSRAKEYFEAGQYAEAEETYFKLGRYKDAENLAKIAHEYAEKKRIYEEASIAYKEENYDEAIVKLKSITDFYDSEDKLKEVVYEYAIKEFNDNNLVKANELFLQVEDYRDSATYLARINVKKIETSLEEIYEKAVNFYNEGKYKDAVLLFDEVGDYKDSKEYLEKCQDVFRRASAINLIAAGVNNSVAITEKGTVRVAGTGDNGQKKVQDFKNIISVDVYGCFVAGITEAGKVVYAGEGVPNEQPDVSEWENIVDIACGENYIVALDKNGKVHPGGHGASGALDVENWEDVIAVDAGWSFTVALTKDKELKFAGTYRGQQDEYEKKRDEWKNVVNIAAGGGGSEPRQRGAGHTVGLCADGTVVAVGDNSHNQCDVYGWTDIVKVAAGDWYTVGLKKMEQSLLPVKIFRKAGTLMKEN